MYNFCTLFNTKYLSRGLALYHSLKNVCNDFHLYIFAFDDQTYAILNKLQLPDTTIISLSQFEVGLSPLQMTLVVISAIGLVNVFFLTMLHLKQPKY